ncbi:MAG: hypothetical protein EOO22_03025 [Comamonadaceae bacterium]|nr:MAG: hypothetical protein EOO22_03025 [Comamonadaceae bacterium]
MTFKTRLCRLFLLSITLALTACVSFEPGMHLEKVAAPTASDAAEPQPDIRLITASLIAEQRAARAERSKQNVSSFAKTASPYVIGNGDLLSILVWNHPELNIAAAAAQALSSSGTQGLATPGAQTPAAYVVDQDGRIQFPYLGALRVAGLTELEARNLLADQLLRAIKKPEITLRVVSFRSKKVYVDGEVKTPGNQPIDDAPMTLLEAFTRAGGLLPTADQSEVLISRAGATYPVNIPGLVRQGVNPSDIVLADGDVVRVRSRDENKVYVLGEVNTPKSLPLVNGRLSLTDALGEAGGLNQLSASGKQVYVVRNGAEGSPLVFNLDAQSPVAMALADSFELSPRDVVFVDASGLARFNRVLTLILPNSVNATSSYYNLNATRR